jgi:hypothetical protein
MPTPSKIEDLVLAILRIAYRVLGSASICLTPPYAENRDILHRIEWPLFIAGVETKDPIYQKLSKGNFGINLEKILSMQKMSASRVDVRYLRKLYEGS